MCDFLPGGLETQPGAGAELSEVHGSCWGLPGCPAALQADPALGAAMAREEEMASIQPLRASFASFIYLNLN